MSWEMHQIMAVINLALCLSICWSCLCRLNAEICRRYLAARTRYTLLLGGAVASGLQPLLWGEWPSVADTLFAAAVLAGLVINATRWRGQIRGKS